MASILFLIATILLQSIQIELSKKGKTFSGVFSEYFKLRVNFEHL